MVRLALLAALVRLVLLDPQDLVARKDLLVLMEPLVPLVSLDPKVLLDSVVL